MKYLKSYEQNIDEPQIGDYITTEVNITTGPSHKKEFQEYINSSVGQIIKILHNATIHSDSAYLVEYPLSIFNIKEIGFGDIVKRNDIKYIRFFISHSEIIMWSSNKEKLELNIQMNKYNL